MQNFTPRAIAFTLALAGLVAKLALLGWLLSPTPARANEALAAGRAIFLGQQPLPARLSGQNQPLPVAASRCINCHTAPGLRQLASAAPAAPALPALVAAAGAATGGYGPVLNSAALMQPRPRRGGPPSRYDATSLCRVMREGVDPAGVVLPPSMPRYTLDDASCRALWTLLTSDL